MFIENKVRSTSNIMLKTLFVKFLMTNIHFCCTIQFFGFSVYCFIFSTLFQIRIYYCILYSYLYYLLLLRNHKVSSYQVNTFFQRSFMICLKYALKIISFVHNLFYLWKYFKFWTNQTMYGFKCNTMKFFL